MLSILNLILGSRIFFVFMKLRIFGIEPVARMSSKSSSLTDVWDFYTLIVLCSALATTTLSIEILVGK